MPWITRRKEKPGFRRDDIGHEWNVEAMLDMLKLGSTMIERFDEND